jgi:hypothetical protein
MRVAASNSSFEGFAMVPIRYALDDLQLKCIGLITAEWSMVEAILSVAIWDFCGLERTRGLSVTADLGSLAKINMTKALGQNHFKAGSQFLAEFTAMMDQVETLNSGRNIIVHHLWTPGWFAADSVRGMKASTRRGQLKESKITKTTRELMDTYQRITEARARLEDFLEESGVTPASRPKP